MALAPSHIPSQQHLKSPDEDFQPSTRDFASGGNVEVGIAHVKASIGEHRPTPLSLARVFSLSTGEAN